MCKGTVTYVVNSIKICSCWRARGALGKDANHRTLEAPQEYGRLHSKEQGIAQDGRCGAEGSGLLEGTLIPAST